MHPMKVYRGVKVQLFTLLNLTQDGGATHPATLLLAKDHPDTH